MSKPAQQKNNEQAQFTKDDEAWIDGYFVGLEDHDCFAKRMLHIKEILRSWWKWKRIEWAKYRKEMAAKTDPF